MKMIPLAILTVCGLVTSLPFTGAASEQEAPVPEDARLYVVDVREDVGDGGTAAYVRVTARDSAGTAASLGVAPVEEDGSVFVRVPAGTPLRFEVLDAEGALLAGSEEPVTLSPGELRGMYRLNEPPGLAPPPPRSEAMPSAVTREPNALIPAPPVRSGR